MAEINLQQATALPADLQLVSPTLQEPEVEFIRRVIPGQSWAATMAINFIMMHENDLRDNAVLADVIASTISATVDRGISQSDLEELYQESVTRREEIDLEPVNETTYKNQRDPSLLRNFVVDVLVGLGIEEELAEDIVESLPDDRIVEITDDAVSEQRERGNAAEVEARAEEIAIKLGLQYEPGEPDNQNLVVPGVFVTDSTDPYIKKVIE